MEAADIKTFQAKTMPEALARVRDELGSDAVILQTRQLSRTGLMGNQPAGVEITACHSETALAPRPSATRGTAESISDAVQSREALLKTQIDSLSRQVDELSDWKRHATKQSIVVGVRTRAEEASTLQREMTERQIAEPVISACLSDMANSSAAKSSLRDSETLARVANVLASRIRTDAALPAKNSLPAMIAFLGASGVGKTTALVRLAAHLKRTTSGRIAALSVDDRRVGACRQLETMGSILGLQLASAATPAETQARIAELAHFDFVLIDTPGITPSRRELVDELSSRIPQCAQTHLVLPASASLAFLESCGAGFASVGIDRLLLSKLDEAGWGTVVSAAAMCERPVGFVSSGRDSVGGFSAADARALARGALASQAASTKSNGKRDSLMEGARALCAAR